MKSHVRGRTAAALSLTLCLLASQALAAGPLAPAGERGRALGEMTSFGQVLINGEEAASGATVFPGNRFATGKKSGAEINLGELGRVRLAAETVSLINFGERKVEGALDAGVITVSKPQGVAAVFSTRDGQVIPDKDSAAVFTLNVTGGNTVVKTESGSVTLRAGETTKVIAAGQSGSAGTQTQGGNNEPDKDGWFWLGVAGFTGEVVGAIIWAVTRDNNETFPSREPVVIVPSPSR